MNAMAKETETIILQVAVELPPLFYGEEERVGTIISTIFENDSYDVQLVITNGEELKVHVLIPRLRNSEETSILEHDRIASALITQRLLMSL